MGMHRGAVVSHCVAGGPSLHLGEATGCVKHSHCLHKAAHNRQSASFKNSVVINGPGSPQFIFYFSENSYPCRKPVSVIRNYLVHEEIAVSGPKSPGTMISKADTREVKSSSEGQSAK